MEKLNKQIQQWTIIYNAVRPHSSIGYQPLTNSNRNNKSATLERLRLRAYLEFSVEAKVSQFCFRQGKIFAVAGRLRRKF